MRPSLSIDSKANRRAHVTLGLVLLSVGTMTLQAQDATPPSSTTNEGWERYDWLQSSTAQQPQTALGGTFNASSGQDLKNPDMVLSKGSLWQEKYGVSYLRPLGDSLSLSCETSAVTLSDGANPYQPQNAGPGDDLYREQKVGLQFQPIQALTLRSNLHDSSSESAMSGDSTVTSGFGVSIDGRLPTNAVLTLNLNSDRTGTDMTSPNAVHNTTYDAQLSQPLGKVPLTAVLKGHYEETITPGTPAATTQMPSLEQSLVWKPLQETTLQMGLRQQQYQSYPGITNELNDALFADWSQTLLPTVSWHSYAEVLNSRSLVDDAPASPLASGANGTPQATGPGSNASLTSVLPLSLTDQTLTFSTGPSFKVQKDLSASIEYSSRWDQAPSSGSVAPDQRVSVSLKGSF